MKAEHSTHALLSPSSAKRWLNCTPSARLEENEPNTSSPYAQEGTEAHKLAEITLSYMLDKINVQQYEAEFEAFKIASRFYNAEFNSYVMDYCKEVMAIITEDYKGQELIVALEVKVDFSDIVPDGRGTSDVCIVGKDFIHIIDLKFGKGVAVSAIGNEQLRLYALGAARKYQRNCMCREVRMTIIQPRLDDISTDFVHINELNDWALNYVKPRALMAISGAGELVPGDHCKFCKYNGKCNGRGQIQLEQAQKEFEDVVVAKNILEPKHMTPEMIARILTIAPKFIDWFADVQKYATNAMINEGLKIPGFKLVEGRSNRVLTNPDAIISKLVTAGFTVDELLEPRKILGITALEKVVSRKLLNDLCREYIVKPAGRPTVATESDKREALDASQFKLIGQEFDETADHETDNQ